MGEIVTEQRMKLKINWNWNFGRCPTEPPPAVCHSLPALGVAIIVRWWCYSIRTPIITYSKIKYSQQHSSSSSSSRVLYTHHRSHREYLLYTQQRVSTTHSSQYYIYFFKTKTIDRKIVLLYSEYSLCCMYHWYVLHVVQYVTKNADHKNFNSLTVVGLSINRKNLINMMMPCRRAFSKSLGLIYIT